MTYYIDMDCREGESCGTFEATDDENAIVICKSIAKKCSTDPDGAQLYREDVDGKCTEITLGN